MRNPTILLRRAFQVALRFRLLQTDGSLQLPQLQDLIPVLRVLQSCIELLVADPAVFGDLAGNLAPGYARDVVDGGGWSSGIEPDTTNGRRKEVATVLVVLEAGGDVGYVIRFDAHKDIRVSSLSAWPFEDATLGMLVGGMGNRRLSVR